MAEPADPAVDENDVRSVLRQHAVEPATFNAAVLLNRPLASRIIGGERRAVELFFLLLFGTGGKGRRRHCEKQATARPWI